MTNTPSVGDPIPAGDVHGISVQLPKWQHTVGWAARDPEVLSRMQTGYPRFFIPLVVDKLAEKLLSLYFSRRGPADYLAQECTDGNTTLGLILQTGLFARQFKEFMVGNGVPRDVIGIFSFGSTGIYIPKDEKSYAGNGDESEIHLVAYPSEHFPLAKSFWQHTGFGISSRCAEYWINRLNANAKVLSDVDGTHLRACEAAASCKTALRERLARVGSTNTSSVDALDVFLYPTGMSATSHTARAAAALKGSKPCKAAVFGFLYVDTFKVLTTVYNFDYVLYGHASSSDLEDLECELAKGNTIDILYLEIPGNPLLQSPDLERIHSLSKQYHFLVVVDDTVGTSVNLAVLDCCDIVCTSLSKMFSGTCNVMGGSITLNARSPYYKSVREKLKSQFVDAYFAEDVIIMERNSRDFSARVMQASQNTDLVYRILAQHRTVTRVYYPKDSTTQQIYDSFKRPGCGYGFLLSITFVSPACAIAFHDALHVAKGPSLGTNFTLACAYTLLAHAKELEWAAKHGLVEHLVRISVGLEDTEILARIIREALDAAEMAIRTSSEQLYV